MIYGLAVMASCLLAFLPLGDTQAAAPGDPGATNQNQNQNSNTSSSGQTGGRRATPADGAGTAGGQGTTGLIPRGDADVAAKEVDQDAIGAKFEDARQGNRGLRVVVVNPNSPASQAGLEVDDRVLAADGRPFLKRRHLEAYLSAQAGRPVPLLVERHGRESTINLIPQATRGDHGWLGVLLEEATANNAVPPNGPLNQQGLPGNGNANPGNAAGRQVGKGAEIAEVAPDGPADRAGLRPGDIITHVDGKEIDDAAELIADIHEMKPSAKIELTVLRKNEAQKFSVVVGNRKEEVGAGQAPANGPPIQLQLMEQNRRIEQELRQLRDEVRQLREQLQKK